MSLGWTHTECISKKVLDGLGLQQSYGLTWGESLLLDKCACDECYKS